MNYNGDSEFDSTYRVQISIFFVLLAVKLVAVIAFAVYLHRINRKSCFDISIVTLLIVKTLVLFLGPVVHLLFATQYVKTCLVVPRLRKKAELILQKHRGTIQNGIEETGSIPELLQANNAVE